jgi:molybdate transport system regulatory protein
MMEAGEGRRVTLSVPPWDIALATGPVAAVSIRNQLRGIVTRVSVHERGVLVEVDVGTRLLAEISRSAAATLGIREGAAVVCLIKTQSIECTGSS